MDDSARIEKERQKFRRQLANIDDLEDPLDVYDQYVQWTLQTYGEHNPNSGLRDLLGQATRAFMNDPVYKTDLRYLKFWTLYAGQVDRPAAFDIYANLLTREIGTSFSLLYEGYAALLEVDGQWKDAENIYRQGIRRQARPLDRLRKRYQEFQRRSPLTNSKLQRASAQSHRVSSPAPASSSASNPSLASVSSSTSGSLSSSRNISEDLCQTRELRYALMLAPRDPGKRPEKYHFDLSLLYTKESGEYCIQEARARAMGLLGKKWPPPPEALQDSQDSFVDASSDSTIIPTDFNDDGVKSMVRQNMFEPTVTINTRAALEDVFGMYNSPDRTRVLPGSKNAPLKQVRLSSAGITPRTPAIHNDENATGKGKAQASTPAFRPYVDENAHSGRTPSVKISPLNDENRASSSSRPLSTKDSSLDPGINSSKTNISGSLFPSKVFTPVETKPTPSRDVFTAEIHDDLLPGRSETALVTEDVKTPFKVFSRPPEQSGNAFTPKTPSGVFVPFVDPKPAFTPFRDAAPTFTPYSDQKSKPVSQPLQPRLLQSVEEATVYEDQESSSSDNIDDEEEEEDDHIIEQEQYEVTPQHVPDTGFEEEDSYEQIPLGGRFGRFNVMTPITERTFEFTTSTRGSATPSERLQVLNETGGRRLGNVFTPQHQDEHGAVIAAERLAAELKEEEEREGDEPLEPLRLSAYLPPQDSPGIAVIEEKTGTMSLGDTLALGAQFRPPNPCNPFDPPIMKNLLSRIPSDAHFYDLRDRESNKLDVLQKFAKKSRKTSGSGNTGVLDVASSLSLELDGHKFSVLEKLGEGGFGAVFKAQDIGAGAASEDFDDLEEDDEENLSMVALKVVKPRNTWEYHVLRRLHSVMPVSLRRSIILPHALYAFQDESFLVLDLCQQGTLLSTVNNAGAAGVSQQGACLDELLVIFFTVELLRLLETMHRAGFIHGDLKIDNCLLRLEEVPGGAAAWSSVYSAAGEGGWSYKGLKVIDFGRTVDTRLFPQNQTYIADWPTDDRDCFEARENRPWTFQTDYFGLVGIIYCMLFGKYITASAINSTSGTHKLSTPLKRYWQTDLWNRLFHVLLNPCSVRPDGQLPVSEELGALREEMEAWLRANCNRASGTLKGLLKKLEVSSYTAS
ncbi:hypothetical protein H0H92_005767 [Tricholoma furcatifolium]|nr:hypothetical protein H0H92_005767 [Tricholoma furcatifolium]